MSYTDKVNKTKEEMYKDLTLRMNILEVCDMFESIDKSNTSENKIPDLVKQAIVDILTNMSRNEVSKFLDKYDEYCNDNGDNNILLEKLRQKLLDCEELFNADNKLYKVALITKGYEIPTLTPEIVLSGKDIKNILETNYFKVGAEKYEKSLLEPTPTMLFADTYEEFLEQIAEKTEVFKR